jgi:hypothetical protein
MSLSGLNVLLDSPKAAAMVKYEQFLVVSRVWKIL